MKKISMKLVLNILGLVVVGLKGAITMAKKIMDIVDDGKANDSFEAPVWLMNVEAGLEYAQRCLTCFNAASDIALADAAKMTDEPSDES